MDDALRFPGCNLAEDCPSEEHYVNCQRFPGLTIPLVLTRVTDDPQIPAPGKGTENLGSS